MARAFALPVALISLAAGRARGQAGLCKWCPTVLPRWAPTGGLAASTISMSCNNSGLLRPETLAEYRLAFVDCAS